MTENRDRLETFGERPVLQSGVRRATFGWLESHMSGRIQIDVTAEFAFADEEPDMSLVVAAALREHADRLSTEGSRSV